eukprot:CAMPEP_0185811138 /NCGR_PEP_ID=MMETSP1322-20130828/7619_1 /TAXON_ID=265543 /ORGANISM="Minutocellus polymorphus, Strain RCC2270" /LENGTH=138 /DNA_ID=CAMNT_0028507519 /DNA_START=91 /DNA_END=506 /DNA_ORIENTATION=-
MPDFFPASQVPVRSFGPPFGLKSMKILSSLAILPFSCHDRPSPPLQPGLPSAPLTRATPPSSTAINRAHPGWFGSEYDPVKSTAPATSGPPPRRTADDMEAVKAAADAPPGKLVKDLRGLVQKDPGRARRAGKDGESK